MRKHWYEKTASLILSRPEVRRVRILCFSNFEEALRGSRLCFRNSDDASRR